jgi:hypothetical protein
MVRGEKWSLPFWRKGKQQYIWSEGQLVETPRTKRCFVLAIRPSGKRRMRMVKNELCQRRGRAAYRAFKIKRGARWRVGCKPTPSWPHDWMTGQ